MSVRSVAVQSTGVVALVVAAPVLLTLGVVFCVLELFRPVAETPSYQALHRS